MREASQVAVRHAPCSESMRGRLRREVGEHRVSAEEGRCDGVPPSGWKVRIVVHGDDLLHGDRQAAALGHGDGLGCGGL